MTGRCASPSSCWPGSAGWPSGSGGSVSCRSYVRQLQAAADVAVARWPALAGAPFVAAGGQAGAPADTDWWQQLTPARLVALADARFDRPDWTAALLPVLA